MNRDTSENDKMIVIDSLRKQYYLGRSGAATLQGAIKEWRAARKEGQVRPDAAEEVFWALDGISLTVRRGETLGIIGRNGAGKSTLLKILSRITAPTEGTVDLYGRVASMLEVGTGFHREMTGRENIYLNGAILGMSRAEIDAKIDDIIAFAGLEKFIEMPVKRYSSGMFVKLGFSVATHLDSDIIIMDEVLAVGDMDFQKKCIDRLTKAATDQQKTVLFVSHNMNSVRQLCDRCIVLDHGKILYDGDTEKAIAIYLGTEELLPKEIVFGREFRLGSARDRSGKAFTMERLNLVSHSSPLFAPGDEPAVELVCHVKKGLKGVFFRLEIWTQDGTKIASMLSGNSVDPEKGTCRIRIEFPVRHLASGQYRADLAAYQQDEKGNEFILDAVCPGLIFQVAPEQTGSGSPVWKHKSWGSVRLHDMRLQMEEMSDDGK